MPLRLSQLEQDAGVDIVMPEPSPYILGETRITFQDWETIAHPTRIGEEFISFFQPLPRPELTFEDQTQLSDALQNGKSKTIEIAVPRLEWVTGADPTLTSSVRNLLRVLWAIVVSRAMQVGFPLRRTMVSVFEDPTEQERKVVLRLACNTNAVQALAFWDSLENDLQGLLATLSETDRTTFITKISLRVHWQ